MGSDSIDYCNADYYEDTIVVQPDVYPGTLTLIPGGTRQLKSMGSDSIDY